MITDKVTIASHLNSYFTSLAENLVKNITDTPSKFTNYLKKSITDSIFLSPTSPQEIKAVELIIPTKVIKYLPENILWPDKCNSCDIWFNGPPFLSYDINRWPDQPSFLCNVTCDDPEVKSTEFCFTQLQELLDNPMQCLYARYSNFHGLLRTVTWLLRYKRYLYNLCFKRGKSQFGLLTASELE